MSELFFEADASLAQENSGSFDPLPAGTYSAVITSTEQKKTKAGTGSYISIRFDITGPTHEGRVVYTNMNVKNPNQKAEEIARKQLNELMLACGIQRITDDTELVGGRCNIKLSIRKSDEYGDSNEVKAYSAIEGSAMPTKTTTTSDVTQAATPPWKR